MRRNTWLALIACLFAVPRIALAIPGSAAPEAVVEVPSDTTWVDTGVFFDGDAGDVVVVHSGGVATGNINVNVWIGPDGSGERSGGSEPCNICSSGMILGRIGPTGTIFRVGSFVFYTVPPGETGNLELIFNDNNLSDNIGSFWAQVFKASWPSTGLAALPASHLPADIDVWPNPFRSHTNLAIRTSRDADVNVGVYDVAGRRVASLRNGVWTDGKYSLTWDGTGADQRRIAPGTYLLRVRSGSDIATKKLTLLR